MEQDDDDTSINAIKQETRVRVAMDSGSCRNLTQPSTIPAGVEVTPNTSGKQFSGAGGKSLKSMGNASLTSRDLMVPWDAGGMWPG